VIARGRTMIACGRTMIACGRTMIACAALIRTFHIGNARQRRVVFDVPIHHMTKLLFGLLVFGSQYHHATFGGFVVFVAAKSAIIHESIGILAIDFDVVHIVAFGTKLHFCYILRYDFMSFPFSIF